jgi:hypothetical protein
VLFYSDGFHYFRSYSITPPDGVIFTNLAKAKLTQTGTDPQGQPIMTYVDVPFEIPMGDYDVWLNGNILIDNLDYRRIDNGFVVFNKSYLNPTDQIQEVAFRAHGKPGTDANGNLTWRRKAEYGFVHSGKLSRDSEYDLHRSSNLRLSVGGAIKFLVGQDLIEESGTGLMPNGKPYELKEPILPLDGITTGSYEEMEKQAIVDKRVKEYLTARISAEAPSVQSVSWQGHLCVEIRQHSTRSDPRELFR